jgi:GAF domain-containing protein
MDMSDLDNEIETLCFRLLTDQVSRASFIERCVELAGHALDCSRSALWTFTDTPAGREMRCVARHDRTRGSVADGGGDACLGADRFFHLLTEAGQVVANDVRDHPATRIFIDDPAPPRAVRSLIAVPCFLTGKLVGAFVCTQVDEVAPWSTRQLFLLRRLSVRATAAMAAMTPPETDRSSR